MNNYSLRFYPDIYKPFPNEPTRDSFSIHRFENGVGEGLVSHKEFLPGQIVFAFTGEIVNEITQYTLQVMPGLHIHDPFVMGKVLHSCQPNTDCDMERFEFIAKKVIKPGDLISMDYDQTEDVLFKAFECSCGCPECRGYIHGSKAFAHSNVTNIKNAKINRPARSRKIAVGK